MSRNMSLLTTIIALMLNYIHILGRNIKAEQLVRDRIKVEETPTLWCLLGDIRQVAAIFIILPNIM